MRGMINILTAKIPGGEVHTYTWAIWMIKIQLNNPNTVGRGLTGIMFLAGESLNQRRLADKSFADNQRLRLPKLFRCGPLKVPDMP